MTETLVEWDDSFLIGIKELDFEHRSLIEDINRLHKELTEHDEKRNIERCLGDILVRLQAHFALEEHVMKEHEYPYYEEHKREHNKLLDDYTRNINQFLDDSGTEFGHPIEDHLKSWLIGHILNSDKKMSQMVNG